MLIKKLKLRANEHPIRACLFSLQALQNATSDISYFQLKIIPTVAFTVCLMFQCKHS